MENPINPWMIWGENPLFSETPLFCSILLADLGGMTEERMKKAGGKKMELKNRLSNTCQEGGETPKTTAETTWGFPKMVVPPKHPIVKHF